MRHYGEFEYFDPRIEESMAKLPYMPNYSPFGSVNSTTHTFEECEGTRNRFFGKYVIMTSQLLGN